ncbi:hypothetical protein J3R82DRAFT_45 [Butyriboletus roseoflavus]|nr:hypothetical protein J3R82DRAFT_45 [Butyriboletus roseoflavus]
MLVSALFIFSPPFPVSVLQAIVNSIVGQSILLILWCLRTFQLGLEMSIGSMHMLSPSSGFSDACGPGFFSTPCSLIGSNSFSGKGQFHVHLLPNLKTHLAPNIIPCLTRATLLQQDLSMDSKPRTEVKAHMSLASTGHIPLLCKVKGNEVAEKEREKEQVKTFLGHFRP